MHSSNLAPNRSWRFNPSEIAFSGYSGSGKTTLICSLIRHLADRFTIAYVKHDAHRFYMDSPGKDTDQARKSGASLILINDSEDTALIGTTATTTSDQGFWLRKADLAIIEGYKHADLPKIILLDKEEQIIQDIIAGIVTNVVACAGPLPRPPSLPALIPFFSRDDISAISTFADNFFASRHAQRPLYGLVLAGGTSRRMGTDKALLHYHGKPQITQAIQMLAPFCQRVFASVRSGGDVAEAAIPPLDCIEDRFCGFGPLGGLLSAMTTYPTASWLVIACDMPFLTTDTLAVLLAHRNPYKTATVYQCPTGDGIEPLCAIYESKAALALGQALISGDYSLQRLLAHEPHTAVPCERSDEVANVNTPLARAAALSQLQDRCQKH